MSVALFFYIDEVIQMVQELIEQYKNKVCTNCDNSNCTNKIKITRTQDICIEQISTITTVKCKDFICKEKRKKTPIHWQGW